MAIPAEMPPICRKNARRVLSASWMKIGLGLIM
jgi:hypothetical protein